MSVGSEEGEGHVLEPGPAAHVIGPTGSLSRRCDLVDQRGMDVPSQVPHSIPATEREVFSVLVPTLLLAAGSFGVTSLAHGPSLAAWGILLALHIVVGLSASFTAMLVPRECSTCLKSLSE